MWLQLGEHGKPHRQVTTTLRRAPSFPERVNAWIGKREPREAPAAAGGRWQEAAPVPTAPAAAAERAPGRRLWCRGSHMNPIGKQASAGRAKGENRYRAITLHHWKCREPSVRELKRHLVLKPYLHSPLCRLIPPCSWQKAFEAANLAKNTTKGIPIQE